jgi:hypothetical protein
MTREEFSREQNAQLEEARRRDERRHAMVRITFIIRLL